MRSTSSTRRPTTTPPSTRSCADVIRSIAAFRTEGRDVVVHCHGGRSRTGLVLRAWLQQHEGLDYDSALVRAQQVWPHTATYNQSFEELLRRLGRFP